MFFAVVSAAGYGVQQWLVRGEKATFPPSGQLVDIGGRRLHLICIGQGTPTVIFEGTGFGSALSALEVRTDVAKRTRVCSYDRRGTSWSDVGPSGPITINDLVDDLDLLLTRAQLPPPYVVVAASIGGLTAEMFARRHPDRVSGLVFLDAANSVALERVLPKIANYWPTSACVLEPLAAIGVLRAVDPLGFRKKGEAMTISRVYRTEPMQTFCGLVRGANQSLADFNAAPPLRRDMPLTVLIAGAPRAMLPFGVRLIDPDVVREAQKAFAAHSTKGVWRVVDRSDHVIASMFPEVVTAAILEQLPPLTARR